MIALEEAQARLLALAIPVSAETVSVGTAHERYLASDISALRSQPAQDLSAMDGYAIRFEKAAGTWVIVGESAAGSPFDGTISGGQAARISTGAAVPAGADTVIIQELVVREAATITHMPGQPIALQRGANIRRSSSDFSLGDRLIAAGTRLNAAHIGLLALAGHAEVSVYRRIKIALVTTGDELVAVGEPMKPTQIPNSNSPMLAALLAKMPVDLIDLGIAPDDLECTKAAILAGHDADLIVIVGGASVGDHDLVQPALIALGATINFWKIAMRPGKPVMVGMIGSQIVVGLPGNPVSAYVTALLLIKPLIAALSGANQPLPQPIVMQLGAELAANGPRTDHIRAKAENGVVFPLKEQDSAALKMFAAANSLIVRTPNSVALPIGAQVDVIMLDTF